MKETMQNGQHFHHLLVFTVLFLSALSSVEATTYDMELKLTRDLLSRTSTRIRPVENTSRPVNVTMDMTLSNVIDIDEVYQIITVNMWLSQEWINERMQWDPKLFGGIKDVTLHTSDIWQPDIVLYNNVFEEFDGRLDHVSTLVRVYYNGSTHWNAPFIFKTLCKIQVKNFPFDLQECTLKFGSWQYDSSEIDLHYVKTEGKLDNTRVRNGEWDVIRVKITRNALSYPCCPDVVYPDITFIVQLRRRSLFYIFNLIIPNFLIALLAFFSFYIPIECGERISFVITVLLSMTVFLLLVAESIPPTSEALPAIALYYTSSMILVALALVATGITLKVNYSYKPSVGGALHPRVKRFIFNVIGPCLGFDCRTFREHQCFSRDSDKPEAFCCKRLLQKASNRSVNNDVSVQCSKGSSTEQEIPLTPTLGNYEESAAFNLKGLEVEPRKYPGEGVYADIRTIAAAVEARKDEDERMAEGRLAAAIVDRAFMYLFTVVFFISTIVILVTPYASNDEETPLA
ncbi:neuronal acetylcholine receptor subunit alpha-10 isoform X4 [Nematostella vectensis]|uniref:neuronal acetylcholine receptor subunit alpha-10 isoform X4 n=1 Tax=Nematostella vectensis TaxID=45351 RepID=UPI002076EE6E|nr:neuronal acetylcholine receptor subunit alpha-10 isoform X4 [Nematostella vectensis]